MSNDHYISRFLTQPWETADRRLEYYDFIRDTFGKASSKRLFAKRGLYDAETEKTFGKVIETPVGEYRAKVLRDGPAAVVPLANEWRVHRALSLLIWMQAQRLIDAHRPGTSRFDLAVLMKSGGAEVD